MSIEEAIYTRLGAVAGITSLIGSGDNLRAYPTDLPQSASVPAVVFQRISGVRAHAQDDGGPAGFSEARFQFTCWDDDPDGAKDLGEAVRLAFDGFKGTVAGIRIDRASIANDFDDKDPDSGSYRRIVDVMFSHAESTS